MGDNANEQAKRVSAMPYVVDSSDTRPHWEKLERSESTEVIHAFGAVAGGKALEPYYMTQHDRRKERAEAIAKAVESAIMRGEIDESVFG